MDELVKRCESLLARDVICNDELLNSLRSLVNLNNWRDLGGRMQAVTNGTIKLAFNVIRRDLSVAATKYAWDMIQKLILSQNVDDTGEMEPIEIFAEMGGLELCEQELSRPNAHERNMQNQMMLILGWVCTNDNVVARAVACGAHKSAIRLVLEGQTLSYAMSFLRTASANLGTRAQLKADGVLDAVVPLFKKLEDQRYQMDIRDGFRAGSIIIRLADAHEEDHQLVMDNPILLNKTVSILDSVLSAGQSGVVMGMR